MRNLKKYGFTGSLLLWLGLFMAPVWGVSGLAAQQMQVSGNVKDAQEGIPVPQLSVLLRTPGGTILKYAITDKNGNFTMRFNSIGKEFTPGASLVFSCLGYAEQTAGISAEDIRAGKRYMIVMQPEAIQIKEVVVKAPKVQMRGDTISYNVQSFASGQDKTIGDVLKKMPGIEVDLDGRIKYNGEPINKFYIEGADLLEGRYGLATNNISQKDVAKVEVLENHQPVKALKKVSFSDRAAINIKLKEDAKAKWIWQLYGAGGLGGGYPPGHSQAGPLWNARLFAMRVAGKQQSMTTLKTNNTGEELLGETRTFSMDEFTGNSYFGNYDFPDYINVSPASVPHMDGARTRFNKSVLFNTSNLWKLGQDYTLKGDVSYVYNRIESANVSRTEYFFEDGSRVDDEQAAALQRINRVHANVALTANTEAYYLKNTLQTKLNWCDTRSRLQGSTVYKGAGEPAEASGSFRDILQKAHMPAFEAGNEFQLAKNMNKLNLAVFSVNKLHAAPQSLDVIARTRVDTRAFLTDENVSLTASFRKWNLTVLAGGAAMTRRMERETDTLDNTLNVFNLYAKFRAVYETLRFRILFETPLDYYHYKFIGDTSAGGPWRLFFSPRIGMRWKISPKLSVNLSGKMGETPVSTESYFSGMILNNYKYLQQGRIIDARDRNFVFSMGINYNDPLSLFSASLGAVRSLNAQGTIAEQTFRGDSIINSVRAYENDATSWRFDGRISKGLDFMDGKVELEADYSIFDMQSLQNGVFTPYRSTSLNLRCALSSIFAEWGNFEYNLLYGRSSVSLDGGADSWRDFVKQQLSLNLSPFKRLDLNISGEHYYTLIAAGQSKHLFWLDASATFKLTSDIELSLSVSNILDNKTYSYTLYSGLTSVYRQYTIRPRNLLVGIFWKF